MDKLDKFIAENTGKGIDTDSAYEFQCVDLMHKYIQDVLGILNLRVLAAPAARDIYNNYPNIFGHELFEKIPNTPTGVPVKGDIVLYDWPPYGHVDIFIQGDAHSYRSFSQNWPTGSKSIVVNHPNYNGVLGWLRYFPPSAPTEPMATITQKELDEIRKDRDQHWNYFTAAKETIDSLNSIIKDKNTSISGLQGQVSSLTTQVSTCQSTEQTLKNQAIKVPELTEQINQLTFDLQKARDNNASAQRTIAQLRIDLKAQKPKTLAQKIQAIRDIIM